MKQTESWQDKLRAMLDASGEQLPEPEAIPLEEPTAKAVSQTARLDIIFEKKGRGGKTATIISGFTLDDAEVESLAAKLKKRLGTGGSARGGEILIQGDRRADVLAFLQAQGFKARII